MKLKMDGININIENTEQKRLCQRGDCKKIIMKIMRGHCENAPVRARYLTGLRAVRGARCVYGACTCNLELALQLRFCVSHDPSLKRFHTKR